MSLQRSALASVRSIRSAVVTRPPPVRLAATYPSPLTSLPPSRTLLVKPTWRASYSTASQPPPDSTTTSQAEDEMSEPTGLIAKSGIELLTFGTPNGYKISILLEELKEAYGKEYTWQSINIMKNTQKEPWFVAAGANGRIPMLPYAPVVPKNTKLLIFYKINT
ncbi:hypothetical protein O1611_g10585 [Lasiodiplodia mahajangana]|uniref:Uncharacterized protein n=1 Tax=Lasiodiplodia mahajangana TaxID=1108764 RepID=A0ACC2IWK8_9PEZI|nr:hypothetical protein O1611_g10585 [Lasiodiplodia mahajangana]